MNLRDATKIINKADTGITLNKSEQKLAELMLHAPSEKKFQSFGERPTLSDILRNRASDFHPQNGSAMIDINAIDSSQTALCQKDIEDSDLHHVLKVSAFLIWVLKNQDQFLFLTNKIRECFITQNNILNFSNFGNKTFRVIFMQRERIFNRKKF